MVGDLEDPKRIKKMATEHEYHRLLRMKFRGGRNLESSGLRKAIAILNSSTKWQGGDLPPMLCPSCPS